MGGSYQHCCKEDGSFRDDDFCNMIENLGDAHEACEMMHWMIGYIAKELAEQYNSEVTTGDTAKSIIEHTEEAYYQQRRQQNV